MKNINQLFIEFAEENSLISYMEPPSHSGKPTLHIIFDSSTIPEIPENMIEIQKKSKRIPLNFVQVDLKEKINEYDFTNNTNNKFILTLDSEHILNFFIKAHKSGTPLSDIKKIYIKNTRNEQPYKNWGDLKNNIYEYIYKENSDIPSYIFKNYSHKYSKYDLKEIFTSLTEHYSTKEFKDIADSFCENHKTYITKLDEHYINRIYMEQGLKPKFDLSNQNESKNIFDESPLSYTQLHINKEVLISTYPISKSSSISNSDVATPKEYLSILNLLSASMNSEKNRKSFGIEQIFINAEQNKNPHFLITIGHTHQFNKELFQTLVKNTFEQFISIQNANLNNNIFQDREELSKTLPKIISKIKLDSALNKETNIIKNKNKL